MHYDRRLKFERWVCSMKQLCSSIRPNQSETSDDSKSNQNSMKLEVSDNGANDFGVFHSILETVKAKLSRVSKFQENYEFVTISHTIRLIHVTITSSC